MNKFSLPDLKNRTAVVCSYILNKKSYKFKFQWCADFCTVDIYLINNGTNIYILKGFPIVPNSNLLARIKTSELISGYLSIKNKYDKDTDITRELFSKDFELVYDNIGIEN